MLIECPRDVLLGMPSPEALQMAIDTIGRHYVLPETMEHPAVRSECLRLAYLIQAYCLASRKPERRDDGTGKPRDAGPLRWAPTAPFRDTSQPSGRMTQSSRTRELVDA
jgi:hypothetical protein